MVEAVTDLLQLMRALRDTAIITYDLPLPAEVPIIDVCSDMPTKPRLERRPTSAFELFAIFEC